MGQAGREPGVPRGVLRHVDWGLLAAAAAAPAIPLLFANTQGPDEGVLLSYPTQMLLGRSPNVDFYTVYGPTGYRLIAWAMALIGPDIMVERAIGLLYRIALVLGCAFLLRRFGRRPALVGGLVAAFLFQPFVPVAFAWTGGLVAAVWGLSMVRLPAAPMWCVALGGALLATSGGFRYEQLVFVLAALPHIRSRRALVALIGGFSVGAVPVLVHLATAGHQVWASMTSRLGTNAHLPLSAAGAAVVLEATLCILSTAWMATSVLRDSTGRREHLSDLLFALMLLAQPLQRLDLVHLSFAAPFILSTGAAHAMRRTKDRPQAPTPMFAVHALAWTSTAVLGIAAAVVVASAPIVWVTHDGRRLPLTRDDALVFQRVATSLESSGQPPGRLFIGAQNPTLPAIGPTWYYFLLPEYRPASFYMELVPGSTATDDRRLVEDLHHADQLVLFDLSAESDKLYPFIHPHPSGVSAYVSSCFRVVGTVAGTQILTRTQTCTPAPAFGIGPH